MAPMTGFTHSHPPITSMPGSPITQQRDLGSPSLYQCHVSLRPPIPSSHHHHHHHVLTNGTFGSTSINGDNNTPTHLQRMGSVSANSSTTTNTPPNTYNNLGVYSHAMGLPPPHPTLSSHHQAASAMTSCTGRQSSCSPHASLGTHNGTSASAASTSPYSQVGYNGYPAVAAAACNNSSPSPSPIPHPTSGKQQQFFASCFYSPWV